jgi:hypothetical protein
MFCAESCALQRREWPTVLTGRHSNNGVGMLRSIVVDDTPQSPHPCDGDDDMGDILGEIDGGE